MPTFQYRARNAQGDSVTGTIVADTVNAAARMLDERSLLPVQVNEVATVKRSVLGGRRVSSSVVGTTYEQLADLLRAGVPVLRALDVLSKQSSNKEFQRVLREVHDDVAGGDTLAAALEKHGHVFPSLHIAMIKAGERGGFLEDVLTRISQFVQRQDELKNRFIGAMIYPAVLMSVGLAAVVFLMTFVVPKIRSLLERQELPILTKIVFAISDALKQHYLVVGAVALVLFMVVYGFFQSVPGKTLIAQLQLRAIGIGKVYTMVALCRFCRIFGTLLANGIPILQALQISRDAAGNQILAAVIDEAADNVRGGDSLTKPLARSKVFPPAMVDMIAVAEESNTLEKVLIEIADTQEARTARQIDLFVKLLEPAMLGILGAMVMMIALALLLPILRMATAGIQS